VVLAEDISGTGDISRHPDGAILAFVPALSPTPQRASRSKAGGDDLGVAHSFASLARSSAPLAPAHHAIGLVVHLDLGIFVRQ
jgi:hypothetical protein